MIGERDHVWIPCARGTGINLRKDRKPRLIKDMSDMEKLYWLKSYEESGVWCNGVTPSGMPIPLLEYLRLKDHDFIAKYMWCLL